MTIWNSVWSGCMSNNISHSADYKNENFTSLFDRIINIKFYREKGDTFTLRSDYEPVWDGGHLYFKTCQPKPAIRIQYTQYKATMINVDIYVTNLNIIEYKSNKAISAASVLDPTKVDTKSGVTTNLPNDLLSRKGNPIVKAEIEMGYRGHFHRWDLERPSILSEEQLYKAFLDLQRPSSRADREQLSESQSFFGAHRRCTVTIEWAANINNPPDRVTQFHGYVGSTEVGFQPYSSMVMDDMLPGESGQLTQNIIYTGLNDNTNSIDVVPVSEIKIEEKPIKKKKITPKKKK